MTNQLTEIALQIGVIFVASGAAVFFRKSFHLRWLIIALLLIFVHDALLLRGFGLIPDFVPNSHWNWSGKLLATVGSLAIASIPYFGLANSGLKFRQSEGSRSAWVVFGLFSAVIFAAAIYLGDGRDDVDTILFQWTMPGIEEEIFYRGALLLAFNNAFAARKRILGIDLGWGGILVTMAFGLTHSLFFGAEGVTFDYQAFAFTAIPSFLLLWFREKTGSVILPICAHNVVNGAFTIF